MALPQKDVGLNTHFMNNAQLLIKQGDPRLFGVTWAEKETSLPSIKTIPEVAA